MPPSRPRGEFGEVDATYLHVHIMLVTKTNVSKVALTEI